jgi:N-glycosidase YbiA
MEGKSSTTTKSVTKCPKNTIWFYRETDDFGFLSNFWLADVNIDGKTWPSTEHYFQAMKFPTNPEHQEKIRANKSPASAKRFGKNSNGFRQDWEKVKDKVMYKALVAKFTQHEELKE